MKGRYSGGHMTIYGSILSGSGRIANWAARTNLTEKAKHRLGVIDWLIAHSGDISLAARHFGLDRKTVRSWRDKLRKIRSILERRGVFVSVSTIGRVLKRKGLINKRVSAKKSKAAKSPKQRYPRGFRIICAGDMVQIDTKYVTLLGGRIIYQFTAIDVLTKRRVLKYYSSLLSKNGADFLKYCIQKFPFPIKTIQTDNGKEFLKDFDKMCKELGLPHYFIEVRHPKQNTYVENSHGFDEREFYQQGNVNKDIEAMDKCLERWEYVWNYVRPHQSLNYLTPDEYLQKIQITNLTQREAIILQT